VMAELAPRMAEAGLVPPGAANTSQAG
jgi:hypothetical protein